jgi:hypothetical protein
MAETSTLLLLSASPAKTPSDCTPERLFSTFAIEAHSAHNEGTRG